MKRALIIVGLAVASFSTSAQVPTSAQATAPKKLLFLTHAALYKHTSLGPAEKPSSNSARPADST